MFLGAPFPAWNLPRPGWDPTQAPGRPILVWMTHRFLSIPGLRKCSGRHGALPLTGRNLTAYWWVEKNALEHQALSESTW